MPRHNCQNRQTINRRLVAEAAEELTGPRFPIPVPVNSDSGSFFAAPPTFPYEIPMSVYKAVTLSFLALGLSANTALAQAQQDVPESNLMIK